MEAVAGVTTIDERAGVTVRVAEPLILLKVATICVVPGPLLVARPYLSTDATPPEEELQVAETEMSEVEPSLKVPVATNCCVDPRGMEGLAGATAILTRAPAVTVSNVDADVIPG